MKCVTQQLVLVAFCFLICKVQGSELQNDKIKYILSNHQVSIQRNGQHICGGLFINANFVLTAAHCFLRKTVIKNQPKTVNNHKVIVVGGIDNLNSYSSTRFEIVADKIYFLKDYFMNSEITSVKDIALLRLEKSQTITLNLPLTSRIVLPDRNQLFYNHFANTSGFGHTLCEGEFEITSDSQCGLSNNKLHFSTVEIIPDLTCVDNLSSEKEKNYLRSTDTLICAQAIQRDPEQPLGVCSGDSGSPLIYKNPGSPAILQGLLSKSAYECKETNKPAIFVNILFHLDFIYKVTNNTQDKSIESVKLSYPPT